MVYAVATTTGFSMPLAKQFDLGDGSDVLYFEKFLEEKQARAYLESLNKELPWIRPTLNVYGRKCEQPRETCYVADEGLPTYKYSGYQPIVYKWEDFPVLKSIKDAVHAVLPSCMFNSVLVNRYTNGNDYAAWHADDEKVYGPAPTIASVTLGTEREFLIRRKQNRKSPVNSGMCSLPSLPIVNGVESQSAFDVLLANSVHQSHKAKRKVCASPAADRSTMEDCFSETLGRELHTFMLKHGSLFVMQGYTQRDWEHSVPRRKRANGLRINLSFRYIIGDQNIC
eukprot:c21595_g1_i1 orf=277-1125(-)